jgi:elongation factor P hydroxylase
VQLKKTSMKTFFNTQMASKQERDYRDLVSIFEQLFKDKYRTFLVEGASEPEYIPASTAVTEHRILFTQDYFASALHEVAHWCVAGEERRLLPDYGYWYAPDGRSSSQQAEFEQAEVKPQALEWLFSRACGIIFRVSADNLDTDLGASEGFKQAIVVQVHHYCQNGVNKRALAFIDALSQYYAVDSVLESALYRLEDLS